MIINPLQEKNKQVDKEIANTEISMPNEKIVVDIIEYILNKYINELIEINEQDKKKSYIENIVKERMINKYSNFDKEINYISQKVIDRFLGYYILQKYIETQEISDIRVINYKTIFVKKYGIWQLENEKFSDEKDYQNFVRNCILKNGGKINNENPITVVSDKKYNLRIEAGIAPVNVISPNLVIRIHRPGKYQSLEKLLFSGAYMFDYKVYIFLVKCIISGVNIVISGKGASGKTTLLRTLINKIPQEIAITSNEETAEIFSNHKNIIQREIIQDRKEDKNITLEKLSKQSLVMSNDALVVGELKGEETMNFVDSISTGHRGYATVHASNSANTIDRLVMLMKKNEKAINYTTSYLERILATSIDLIIYMNNFRIKEITQVYYDDRFEKIKYIKIYSFICDKIIANKEYGFFKKHNECIGNVKNKLLYNQQEIERIIQNENNK